MLFALILACGTADSTKTTDTSASTDTSATEDTAPACATVNSGTDWAWHGACPQMTTPVDIVVTGCALALDYQADGGMTMGMPYDGTVTDSTVTFGAGDSVTGCVGDVVSADRIEGTCDGGCAFTLRR